jgi:DNA-binding Lrp family transcriptional regulator
MIGFDEKDTAILAELARGPRSASYVARRTGLRRTTVRYRLQSLVRRRAVQDAGVRNRERLWGLSSRREPSRAPVEMYRGRDMERGYALLEGFPRNSIVYAFEGVGWLRKRNAAISRELPVRMQRRHRARKVTFKSAIHRRYLQLMREMSTLPVLSELRQRSMVTGLVMAKSSFLSDGAYFVTTDFILIANEEKKYVLIIKDKTVVRMIYETLEMFFGFSEHTAGVEHFDFNAFVEQLWLEKGGAATARAPRVRS